ncbi:MAG: S41 family peptidase [Candidatus Portiera sp.]|nr:S41 family peptidase [Portiera sp.]
MTKMIRNFSLALLLSFVILLPSNAAKRSSLPLEEIKEFAKALELIQSNYVEETDEAELIRDAIRGMLKDLDQHSVYLDKRQKETLKIRTQGKFGGLGIQVSYEDNAVKVISPIDDTPAAKAGIQSLDRIISIDGAPTAGLDLGQAVDKMRGKPGSKIVLGIQREGEKNLLKFTLVREVIRLKSVVLKQFRDGYVYTRISSFQEATTKDYAKLLRGQLRNKNLRGVILDLRNNPGGLLSAAVGVSNIFIKNGVIVSTAGRTANSKYVANANGQDLIKGLPLVILINGGSASASEIVAGAIQGHDRGVIVGTKSYGKGTVQSIVELSPNAAIKITTARYMTPDGTIIDGIGIYPDIVIERRDLSEKGKAADLKAHQAQVKRGSFSKDAQAILERDPQLLEAYELLRKLSSSGSVLELKKGT